MIRILALSALALYVVATPATGIELVGMIHESAGPPPADAPGPCGPLSAQRNGNCANYRWYNVCSGYIWIFSGWQPGEMTGTSFRRVDGLTCISPGNIVKRTITYFRNVIPNYNQTLDVLLYTDTNSDGCGETVIASDLNLDPGLRWNCSNFARTIPAGVFALVVATRHHGGNGPTFATDGPFTSICDPVGTDHSFYYGVNNALCLPWRQQSPTGRGDNFLYHLIVDHLIDATEKVSWGSIKGMYR